MTTTTRPTDSRRRRDHPGGFTLVEVMISSALASMVLVGVLTSFLLIGRNSHNAASYSMMEAETRRALETFSEEARMATNLTWHSASSITFTVPTSTSATYLVNYTFDSATTGATARSFYRQLGAATSGNTNPKMILVRNISDFSFKRYKLEQSGVTDNTASNDLETKQIQLTMRTVRSGVTAVDATNAVLSARYILRNKRVSN